MADDQKCSSTQQQVRLMMWTVPRSTSIVLTKCLSFVDNSKVILEPYLAARYFGPEKSATEFPSYMTTFDECLSMLPMTDLGVESSQYTYDWVKTQLEEGFTGKRFVFCKDMAFAITGREKSLPRGYQHLFLLRHPLKVFPSWKMLYQFLMKVPIEAHNLHDIPHGIFPNGYGFKEMSELMDHLKEVHDQEAIIIDSDDLLANPKGTLSALFKAIGLPFDEKILNWEAGDAIVNQWVVSKNLYTGNKLGEYYKKALDSTCFLKPGGLPDRSSLSPDILRCVDASMPYYDKMYAQCLKPEGN